MNYPECGICGVLTDEVVSYTHDGRGICWWCAVERDTSERLALEAAAHAELLERAAEALDKAARLAGAL